MGSVPEKERFVETKLSIDGRPILITGGSFARPTLINKTIINQVRVTYEDLSTDYVNFDEIEVLEHSIQFGNACCLSK